MHGTSRSRFSSPCFTILLRSPFNHIYPIINEKPATSMVVSRFDGIPKANPNPILLAGRRSGTEVIRSPAKCWVTPIWIGTAFLPSISVSKAKGRTQNRSECVTVWCLMPAYLKKKSKSGKIAAKNAIADGVSTLSIFEEALVKMYPNAIWPSSNNFSTRSTHYWHYTISCFEDMVSCSSY